MTSDDTPGSQSVYPRRIIEDLAGKREPGVLFILQPINPAFDPVLEAIRAVGLERGLTVLRADDIRQPGAIVSQVVDNICRAEIVVTDLTGRNANVFYEMGIGHAIREDLILLTQDVQSVPFDLQHLRLIEYSLSDLARLRRELASTIDNVRALPSSSRGTSRTVTKPDDRVSTVLEPRNLADPTRGDFGRNGDSGQLVVRERDCKTDCSAFVVLSLVPEGPAPIDTAGLWAWANEEGVQRSGNGPLSGDDIRPRAGGLFVRRKSSDGPSKLTRYTLIDSSGYLEWGRALGGCHEDLCVVRLTPLLIAVDELLRFRIELASRSGRPQDSLVVSVANARGTALSHLGKGWLEPWLEFRNYAPRCEDSHIQIIEKAPAEEALIKPLLKDVDIWLNRHYGHDGPRGFNHPNFGDSNELNPKLAGHDHWER